MNAEEIIKLNKEALYSSLTSSDTFGKFFNKSILHYAAIMEVFSFNKLGGISYEKLHSFGLEYRFKGMSSVDIFDKIYKDSVWGKDKSGNPTSGYGSQRIEIVAPYVKRLKIWETPILI